MTAARTFTVALALPLVWAVPSVAQTEHISDNSFLVEEAYNQEPGVVQHVNTFTRVQGGQAWDFGFTQEWPFRSMRHQLSYLLPVLHAEGAGTGLGDVQLNYRYQLMGDDDTPLHVAPRFSLLLPTGSENRGRGSGGVGVQAGVPVSYVVNDALAAHWNATLNVEGGSGDLSAGLGASAVLRVHRSVNLMLETVWDSAEDDVVLLNPGVRWAFNFASGLQIVPGVAYTFGLGAEEADALFLYLSFEHPFRRL